MKTGTPYFTSKGAAVRYYSSQMVCAANVDYKIKKGEIFIGRPKIKQGEALVLIDSGTRYAIQGN